MTARRFPASREAAASSRGRAINPWHRGGTTLVAMKCCRVPPGLGRFRGIGSLSEPVEAGCLNGAFPCPITHSGDRASIADYTARIAQEKVAVRSSLHPGFNRTHVTRSNCPRYDTPAGAASPRYDGLRMLC